jgi:hypothetical protein
MSLDASQLKSDEYVMFIPNIAYDVGNKTVVEIKAFVYEKERRLGATTALSVFMGTDIDDLNESAKQTLYDRSSLFRVDFEGDKEFSIKFDDKSIYKMPKTKDGKSALTLTLPASKSALKEIAFELYQPKYPQNRAESFALHPSSEGVSLISDIDDTIKISNVLDKKALIKNTFLNEFKATEGIKKIFNFAINDLNATAFHYVSSSPAQLYPPLKEFLDKEGFPKGSFHLRDTTDLSDFLADKKVSMAHKTTEIEKLFNAYPKRKFILTGDDGENDPEIYAALKRQYPDKVLLIIIRNVMPISENKARFDVTFQGIDKEKIIFF